jgi:mannose-6-phosphate isomerase-like protein (cupin superfamily)
MVDGRGGRAGVSRAARAALALLALASCPPAGSAAGPAAPAGSAAGPAAGVGGAEPAAPAGAEPAVPPPAPVLDAWFPDGRRSEALAALAASEPLAASEDFRVRQVGRDAHTSHHLVWIRDREQPHRHDRHDLVVVILRGFGAMRLGGEERPVGEGSILYVPRGTPHAFRNRSPDVAVAYAVYAPAFDPADRIPSE